MENKSTNPFTCETCKSYCGENLIKVYNEDRRMLLDYGECRRKSPGWPSVLKDDWCGEHVNKYEITGNKGTY